MIVMAEGSYFKFKEPVHSRRIYKNKIYNIHSFNIDFITFLNDEIKEAYMHEIEIVNRTLYCTCGDLKPENLIVCEKCV